MMKSLDLILRSVVNPIRGWMKDSLDSLRLRNYYLRTGNDNRNILAKMFDYSVWRVLISCILFLLLYFRTNQLYLTIIITSIIVAMLHSISVKSRNRKFQQMKEQKRRYIANRRIYDEIMNKTTGEMVDYIKNIFAPAGFNQFELMRSAQRHILLKSSYKNDEVAILFNIYKEDFNVELKEVKEFIRTMTDNKIKRGILITTSNFTNDSYDFINKLGENYALLFINKEQLLKIIEKSRLYPGEEEIDEIIKSKISRKENILDEYKRRIFSKNKVKGYMNLSLYLVLTSWYTPYIIYYMIVAGFILALAVIIFIFNTIYNFEIEKDKPVDLEKMLNNMQ